MTKGVQGNNNINIGFAVYTHTVPTHMCMYVCMYVRGGVYVKERKGKVVRSEYVL